MQYLIIFIFFCSSIFAEDKIVLQLKWEHQFQFAGYYAAIEQGYYKELGLDVEVREQDLKQMVKPSEEVLDGRAHYGVGSSSLLVDISESKELMLLSAMFEHSPLVLLCSKNSDIRTLKDLQNKKIMLAKGETDSLILSGMLEKEGVIYTPVPFDLEKFYEGKADAFTAYIGNEPYTLKEKSQEYTLIDPANYGFDMYSDMLFTSKTEYKQHPKRVHDFIQASIKGWKYAMKHQEEVSRLIIEKYNPRKTLDALMFEASKLRRHAIVDLDNIGKIKLSKLSHMILMMKEIGLMKNSIDIYKYIYPRQLAQIHFTKEENKWITAHPDISYASENWQPYENIHDTKEIAQRYMDVISLKSGLNFKYVEKAPSLYALAELERGKIDLFVGTQESRNVFQSSNIRNYPLVIVTRNNIDYISNIEDLNMKTMALVKGSESAKYIEKNYPKIKKVYVKNVKEALTLVSKSAVYATAEALPFVALHIKEYKMANIKISGEFPYIYHLNISINKEHPILKSIINKTIQAISIEEHNMINSTWQNLHYEKKEDTRGYIIAIILAGMVISILIYSNWRLRFEVSKRVSTEIELQRMLDVVDQNVYMSMTDFEGDINYVSEAFCRLTGYTKEQLLGRNHRVLKNKNNPEKLYDEMWQQISAGKIWKGEIHNISRTGKSYWVDASITPLYNEDGNIFSYMAIRKDITTRKKMENLAITDALSGLYNRRYFNMIFEKEIKRLRREHGVLTFLMLDIDHFKLYNDKYGHLKGDEVIMAVSKSIKEVCQRDTDQVFRLGGEEFGVVLLGMNVSQVQTFAKKIIKTIENLNIKHEENHPYSWVTASLGAVICHFNENTKLDAKDIYQVADEAMYTSKHTGRNRIFISQI